MTSTKNSELTVFDPANHILSEESAAAFLTLAEKTDDVEYIDHANTVVGRARRQWTESTVGQGCSSDVDAPGS